MIAYTDYSESTLEILKKAHDTVEKLNITNPNEKEAIFYILNILSANMLDKKDYNEFMEETGMILNPRDRFFVNKTKQEYEEKLKENDEKLKQEYSEKLKQEKQEIAKKLKQEKQEIAKKLKQEKVPNEIIQKTTGLTEKEILYPQEI